VEYAWFNNVETKPGIGYPKEWENQDKWKRRLEAHTVTAQVTAPHRGQAFRVLANIFANPDLPTIDEYYEPFRFRLPASAQRALSQAPAGRASTLC
jgi:nitrate reductase beta subunit